MFRYILKIVPLCKNINCYSSQYSNLYLLYRLIELITKNNNISKRFRTFFTENSLKRLDIMWHEICIYSGYKYIKN